MRDVPGLPTDSQGFKRGFAYVASADTISGDYFQVDPTNAFATGNRLVADDQRCFVYDLRLIQGGAFTGGTRFQLFVDSPLGIGAADPPTVSFTVRSQDGTVFGSVGLKTDQSVTLFTAGDVYSALPGGYGPTFGSALVIISASAGYGLLQVTYSAEGQYSVGMPASCQTAAP